MDLNAFLDGFALVAEPKNLLYCLIGVLIGMVIGVLPGLGPAATIAILLPITYTINPVSAIIMLAGIYYGAQYGGTITSVLLRLPGEASSVASHWPSRAEPERRSASRPSARLWARPSRSSGSPCWPRWSPTSPWTSGHLSTRPWRCWVCCSLPRSATGT